MSLGTLEVFPNLYDCGQWNGQNSRGMDRHSPDVWLQGPQPEGSVGQKCGDRSLKTQTRLSLGSRYGRPDPQTVRRTLRDTTKERV